MLTFENDHRAMPNAHTTPPPEAVERWGRFELSLNGPAAGNPFLDVSFAATFSNGNSEFVVDGFYDGDGVYRVRFMPDAEGEWTFETTSNASELAGRRGRFRCTPPSKSNHGPVHVANMYHFAYADGTPYRPVGTTSYAWTHQGDALESLTLKTLEASPFNKIRMCVFPKNYAFNDVEPPRYPFEGTPPNTWDFTRFNPAFFRHFENHVARLCELGIEADVILFHPYDEGRWGFDRMPPDADDRYLKYVIARLAAFRNVWWSMANEWDFMKMKTAADFDRYLRIVAKHDPYGHLRGVHNGYQIFNQNHELITHASIQNGSAVADFGRATLYRDAFRKPIVLDEVKYEGNLPQRWGDLTPQEMVHRFWQGLIAGCYTQHGETYLHPDHVIWWARGGELHGQSPARIAFLRGILDAGPATGIDPIDKWQDLRTAGKAGEFYLIYFGRETPTNWIVELPRQQPATGMRFRAEVIDTWNMTITPVDDEFEIVADTTYRYHAKGLKSISMPGRPFMAIRLTRTGGDVSKPADQPRIYGDEG